MDMLVVNQSLPQAEGAPNIVKSVLSLGLTEAYLLVNDARQAALLAVLSRQRGRKKKRDRLGMEGGGLSVGTLQSFEERYRTRYINGLDFAPRLDTVK